MRFCPLTVGSPHRRYAIWESRLWTLDGQPALSLVTCHCLVTVLAIATANATANAFKSTGKIQVGSSNGMDGMASRKTDPESYQPICPTLMGRVAELRLPQEGMAGSCPIPVPRGQRDQGTKGEKGREGESRRTRFGQSSSLGKCNGGDTPLSDIKTRWVQWTVMEGTCKIRLDLGPMGVVAGGHVIGDEVIGELGHMWLEPDMTMKDIMQ
jgi:hypothetical protein